MDIPTFDRIEAGLVSPEHFKLYKMYVQPEGPIGSLTVSVNHHDIIALQAVPRDKHAMIRQVEALGGKVGRHLTLLTPSHAPEENAFLEANRIPPEPPNQRGYDARTLSNITLDILQNEGLVHPAVAQAIAGDVSNATGKPVAPEQVHFGPQTEVDGPPVFQPTKSVIRKE